MACFWPPFLFPPLVPRVSKPGTVNQCLFSAQVCVADPNSMAGKPGACPSSQSKLKNKKKTILYHSLPHFLCLLTQRELEICMWADVYVCVSESVSRLHCCGGCSYSLVGVEFTPLHYHFLQRHWHSSGLNSSSRCVYLSVATWGATQDFKFTDFLWL